MSGLTNNISITQQQFLGASIRGFDVNLGWGESPSVLQVGLVEDDKLSENFEYVIPGSLVRFQYNDWIFDGILDNYQISRSESGNRVIDVTITDPRTILDGVQLILDGYNDGVYNIPNLFNIFGHLESIRYGYADVNDFGIPAYKILESFNSLSVSYPILFQNMQYYVVADLWFLSNDFRVAGANMSLMEFINIICENYNRDYFFEAFGNTIYLRTIDRSFPSSLGVIEGILNNSTDYNSASLGLELKKVTTSKFLVGGQVEEMHFQFAGFNQNNRPKVTVDDFYNGRYRASYIDDMIFPYWGTDVNGNAIIGQGMGYKHWFVLDGRALHYPGFNFELGYPSDVIEMIAASTSMGAWRHYVEHNNDRDQSEENLQQGKFTKLKMIPLGRKDLIKMWKRDSTKVKEMIAKDYIRVGKKAAIRRGEFEFEDLVSRVYKYVKGYADEYYGRKFMVRIPDVQAKFEPLTQSVSTSLEPTTSGFLNSQVESYAVSQGMIPFFRDFVKDDDGKISCYVRFSDVLNIDLTGMNEEDYLIQGNYIFIKATMDPNLVFVDKSNVYSPRVVVTLSAPVYAKRVGVGLDLRDFELENANINETTEKNNVGDNAAYKFLAGLPLMPELAVIPLKNNYKTYGPWYNTYGSTGTCEFEKNSDLVPWNFGSFELMNKAASTMVSDVGLSSPYGENGSITFPGAPTIAVGNSLVASGPYITNINVGFSATDGVTTTYTMSRWATKIGKDREQLINQRKQITKSIAEQKRALRKLYKPELPLGYNKKTYIPPEKTELQQPKSPHQMIFSQVVKQDGGEIASVVTVPFHDINTYLDEEKIEQKAGMSIDGLFRGFSTKYDASGIPKFTKPSGITSGNPTSITLNPFSGGDIGVMVHGKKDEDVDFNNDLLEDNKIESDNIRGIGLRAPVILVGWGYDTNGKPVPNKTPNNPGEEFLSGYKTKQTEWKAGPLDCRWDEKRGVWVAGSQSDILYFENKTGFGPARSGLVALFTIDHNSPSKALKPHTEPSGYVIDANYLFPFFSISGNKGICVNKNGNYEILYSQCQTYPYNQI